jgi:hypothetical protein
MFPFHISICPRITRMNANVFLHHSRQLAFIRGPYSSFFFAVNFRNKDLTKNGRWVYYENMPELSRFLGKKCWRM